MGKTIIYVGGFELPDKNAAAHRVISIAKILREIGYDVVLVSVQHDIDVTCNITETRHIIQGFTVYSMPYPKTIKSWISRLLGIGYICKVMELYTNVFALLMYNMPHIAALKARYICKKKECSFVVDCTEWYQYELGFNPVQYIKALDSEMAMRFSYKKADGLIVISEFLQNYYKNKLTCKIPPLVDIEESIWREKGKNEKKGIVRFVYTGQAGSQKDLIGNVIVAFGQLLHYRNYVFDILGMTEHEFCLSYPELVKVLIHLKHRIHFHGRVSHHDSISYLSRAHFCLFFRKPTRKNIAGFPTKCVESLTCGTSVITNDISDIAKYVDKDSIITGSFETSAIMSAIEKVLHYPSEKLKAMLDEKKIYSQFDYRVWKGSLDVFLRIMESSKRCRNLEKISDK